MRRLEQGFFLTRRLWASNASAIPRQASGSRASARSARSRHFSEEKTICVQLLASPRLQAVSTSASSSAGSSAFTEGRAAPAQALPKSKTGSKTRGRPRRSRFLDRTYSTTRTVEVALCPNFSGSYIASAFTGGSTNVPRFVALAV